MNSGFYIHHLHVCFISCCVYPGAEASQLVKAHKSARAFGLMFQGGNASDMSQVLVEEFIKL
ncbi:hypothetical protein SEVIR_2G283250v4 [Setaria viridis]